MANLPAGIPSAAQQSGSISNAGKITQTVSPLQKSFGITGKPVPSQAYPLQPKACKRSDAYKRDSAKLTAKHADAAKDVKDAAHE